MTSASALNYFELFNFVCPKIFNQSAWHSVLLWIFFLDSNPCLRPLAAAIIIGYTIELFSRRRRTTGPSQQSNNDGTFQCMCCIMFWRFFMSTIAFCLGRCSLHLLLLKSSMAIPNENECNRIKQKIVGWLTTAKFNIILNFGRNNLSTKCLSFHFRDSVTHTL